MVTTDLFKEAGQSEPKAENLPKEKRYNADQGMADLVGAICDPIICYPSPWMDTLPQSLKEQITMDRLIELMLATKEKREPTATDSEALAYMYPASLEAPMGHLWTNIYLFLGTRVVKGQGREFPEDIALTTLDSQEEYELRRLKAWIFEKRRRHRTEKASDIKRDRKEREKAEKLESEPVQHTFDFG